MPPRALVAPTHVGHRRRSRAADPHPGSLSDATPTLLDVEHITPGATQRILQEARALAKGDARVVLALLQGCFFEEAIRIAIDEQPTGRQLAAVGAFAAVSGHRLLDAATACTNAQGASEEPRLAFLGALHNATQEGARFAQSLLSRFETTVLTSNPTDDDGLDDALDALPEDTADGAH